jgi:hypothetical protein
MPVSTYREWLALNNRPNTEEELALYLASGASTEGWLTEFKAAARNPDYGVREAVAGLANARGGEVFVGVDDDGTVTGSPVTVEALNDTLRQIRALVAPWRIVDLMQVVANTTPVPLVTSGLTAYVIEVRAYDLPCFVLTSDGRLALPVRSGSDTKLLDAATSIEWHNSRRRADVLRSCLQELKTFSLQLTQFQSLNDGLPDPLPYIHSIVQDGTAYQLLTPSDRAALFGAGVPNGRTTGAVDLYYRVVRRVRAALERLPMPNRNLPIRNIQDVNMEFANLEADIRSSVQTLETHLRSQGVSVPPNQ